VGASVRFIQCSRQSRIFTLWLSSDLTLMEDVQMEESSEEDSGLKDDDDQLSREKIILIFPTILYNNLWRIL